MTDLSVFSVLLPRIRFILLGGVATALLVVVMSKALLPQYSSECDLIIEGPASTKNEEAGGSNRVWTQVDILQSRSLIKSTIGDLSPDTVKSLTVSRMPPVISEYLALVREYLVALWHSPMPHSDIDSIVSAVQSHLSVRAKNNSSSVAVQFDANSPDVASAVVNAVMAEYLKTIKAEREVEIANIDRSIAQQTISNKDEIEAAQQRITQYMQQHNLSEVQGSLTAAIQLTKDQEQLALAREELARQQALLDTVRAGGSFSMAGAQETLGSKTIQNLKDINARSVEQINSMGPTDPRRISMQAGLSAIHNMITAETNSILVSIMRDVEVSRMKVAVLESTVRVASTTAQKASVLHSTLKQLTSDLDTKQQLYVAFSTQAEQMRIAAAHAPLAHVLFPATPKPVHSRVLAFLLGFAGGIGGIASWIILRALLRPTINSAHEMALVTGLAAFGSLPDLRGNLSVQTHSLIVETFRAMRLAMRLSSNEGKAILVTSSAINEGKTTVATTLAHSFANDGFRVLLIDGDLRHPQIMKVFNLESRDGLKSVLSGKATLNNAVVRDTKLRFDVLIAGESSENPLKTLSSDEFKNLLAIGRQNYDFVILDSPPVMHVADPIEMATLCQHVIFIVEAGRLTHKLVREATRRFTNSDRDKILTLLTRVAIKNLDIRDYFSGYVRK